MLAGEVRDSAEMGVSWEHLPGCDSALNSPVLELLLGLPHQYGACLLDVTGNSLRQESYLTVPFTTELLC